MQLAETDLKRTKGKSKTTREDCRETHFKQTSLEHSMTQQQKQNAALKTHRRQPESLPLNICIDLINCTVNYWNCKILVYNSTVLVLLFFSASWNLIILYLIIQLLIQKINKIKQQQKTKQDTVLWYSDPDSWFGQQFPSFHTTAGNQCEENAVR